jgi:formate/nitrite transporter FocA (FNT family)
MTYLIALGDFSHVIAGSVEAFLLLVDGQIGVYQTVFGFLLPALAGNVLGGTMLFSILAYAQVSQEIE